MCSNLSISPPLKGDKELQEVSISEEPIVGKLPCGRIVSIEICPFTRKWTTSSGKTKSSESKN